MSYDVFLSHSHADKVWVQALHDGLVRSDFNGRALRAWLDDRVLDPGELSSARELHSALDRSRKLALVASSNAMASAWVRSEIDYFVSIREASDVIVLRRESCALPVALARSPSIEWPEAADVDEPLNRLLAMLCGRNDYDEYTHRRQVRRAWQQAFHSQRPGLDATRTRANSELLECLLEYDIADPDEEGSALVGFERIGELLVDIDGQTHYGSKMAVGEMLAVAVLRSPLYRSVLARFVELEQDTAERPTLARTMSRLRSRERTSGAGTNLLFAVARASSKLAEIDQAHIDPSTLWATLDTLDRRASLTGEERALAMMIGRTLAKLRGSPLHEVLVHSLVRFGGAASRAAAATAIAGRFENDGLFYTEELASLAERMETSRPVEARGKGSELPSASLAALLVDGQLRDPLDRHMTNCRDELLATLSGSDVDLGNAVPPRFGPVAQHLSNGPLVGAVRLVTLANMESVAPRLGPADIACLMEPRVVDDLLVSAGGFLIETQDPGSPLCQRLRNRRSRFALLDRAVLDGLHERDSVSLPVPRDSNGTSMGFKLSID